MREEQDITSLFVVNGRVAYPEDLGMFPPSFFRADNESLGFNYVFVNKKPCAWYSVAQNDKGKEDFRTFSDKSPCWDCEGYKPQCEEQKLYIEL